jgi:hypothetical protein
MHRSLTPHIVVSSVKFIRQVRSHTAPSATVVAFTPSDIMEAIQVTGIVSLSMIAFLSLIYGEMKLLK